MKYFVLPIFLIIICAFASMAKPGNPPYVIQQHCGQCHGNDAFAKIQTVGSQIPQEREYKYFAASNVYVSHSDY